MLQETVYESIDSTILNTISNWSMDRTISSTTTPAQGGLGSNDNEEVTPDSPDLHTWNFTTSNSSRTTVFHFKQKSLRKV